MSETARSARSAWECQLVLALSHCRCGRAGLTADAVITIDQPGGRVWRYEASCSDCGSEYDIDFLAPGSAGPPYPAFGGFQPSTVVDAVQFLEVADQAARLVPDSPDWLTADEVSDAYENISIAVAALDEVLKFIPAHGDRVPRTGLGPESVSRYDADPDRFTRRQLIAALGAYRAVQSSLALAD